MHIKCKYLIIFKIIVSHNFIKINILLEILLEILFLNLKIRLIFN